MYTFVRRRRFGPQEARTWMNESALVHRRQLLAATGGNPLHDGGLPHFDAHLAPERGHDFLLTDHGGAEFLSTHGQPYVDRNLHSMWTPDDAAVGISATMNTAAGAYALQRLGADSNHQMSIRSRSGARPASRMLVRSAAHGGARDAAIAEVVLVMSFSAGRVSLYSAYPGENSTLHPDQDVVPAWGNPRLPVPAEGPHVW
jgi:hypothetical protein